LHRFFSAYPSQFVSSSAGAPVWRSTGLYAKAGTVVTVQFTDAAVGKLMVNCFELFSDTYIHIYIHTMSFGQTTI
jgi:hypothetical protein